MAGPKVFQFFLFISYVIFSTHALDVYLTHGRGMRGFMLETEINVRIGEDGSRYYNGCAKNSTYEAWPGTKKVVVYIRSEAQWNRDTLRKEKLFDKSHRVLHYRAFHEYHYELLYLVVDGFTDGDERVISEFLHQSIKPYEGQTIHINTIGEGNMNLDYKTPSGELGTYEEDKNVFGGKLYETIRGIYRR